MIGHWLYKHACYYVQQLCAVHAFHQKSTQLLFQLLMIEAGGSVRVVGCLCPAGYQHCAGKYCSPGPGPAFAISSVVVQQQCTSSVVSSMPYRGSTYNGVHLSGMFAQCIVCQMLSMGLVSPPGQRNGQHMDPMGQHRQFKFFLT